MKEDIFLKIKTTDSAEVFKGELRILLKSLYLGSDEFGSVLKNRVRSYLSEYIINKLSVEDIDIEKLLKDLIEETENTPSVRLIIAYEPSEDAIDRFYSFITSACQRHIFLDIGYSPDIIGGAVIIYEGKYRDFSFKYVFENEFAKERKNILELLEK
jgi:F0F1-type ATP synthase delta subunit